MRHPVSELLRTARQDATASWRRRRRTVVGLALGIVTGSNAACYAYTPLRTGAMQSGDRVSLQVTDEGRVAMREQVGSGVDRIDGIYMETRGEEYIVRVSRVRTIRGTASHWSGEPVRVPLSAVARLDGRYFSRQKTLLATGIAVGAVAVLLLASSLAGFGFDSDRPPEGPPGGGNGQ